MNEQLPLWANILFFALCVLALFGIAVVVSAAIEWIPAPPPRPPAPKPTAKPDPAPPPPPPPQIENFRQLNDHWSEFSYAGERYRARRYGPARFSFTLWTYPDGGLCSELTLRAAYDELLVQRRLVELGAVVRAEWAKLDRSRPRPTDTSTEMPEDGS